MQLIHRLCMFSIPVLVMLRRAARYLYKYSERRAGFGNHLSPSPIGTAHSITAPR
jgi:hypothetical protein